MSEKKYILLDGSNNEDVDSKRIRIDTYCSGEIHVTVYRIMAIKDFTLASGIKVCTGEVGGYIQSEKNLSQFGCSWVDKSSIIAYNGRVDCDAIAKNHSTVYYDSLHDQDVMNNNTITRVKAQDIIDLEKAERERKLLNGKYPPEVRANQVLKNDELKKKINKDSEKTTATFVTKEEKLDNVMKSFSNMNEIYIVKELRL